MRIALDEAALGEAAGDVPVGAVVVIDGAVVASRHNEREALGDPTAHAEVLALRDAAAEVGSWRLLRDGIHMAVQAVPAGIDAGRVNEYLARTEGVAAVHDLHIWPMSTTETALTCHLVMPGAHPGDALLAELAHGLHDRFAIAHVTIQIESGDPAHPCALVPDHVI